MGQVIESYKGNPKEDFITIIDIDALGPNKGIRYIKLPFIPKEMAWNSETSYVAIKPMGRNNPKYHYTGGEDKLEFEIDWHSFDSSREDVIRNCRAIEALSKGDGYSNPPHRVMIQWGWQNILFRDIIFIITSAPYRLTQFNKSQKDSIGVVDTAMLPIQAYQKVTLARITTKNLTSNEIQLVNTYVIE